MPDSGYRDFPVILNSNGLLARYAVDRPPDPRYHLDALSEHTYINLESTEVRQEHAISSRRGLAVITTDGTDNKPLTDTNIHTLGRMKSLAQTYRYAGAGTNIWRRAGDAVGAFTKINGALALSGNRFSMTSYRPDFTSLPYTFFADSSQMLKDNGSFSTAQLWGGFGPAVPATGQLLNSVRKNIELFEADAGFAYAGVAAHATGNRVNTTLSNAVVATGIGAATPASMANIAVGQTLTVDTAGNLEQVEVISITATTFTANFTKTHLAAVAVVDVELQVSINANTTGTVTKAGALDLSNITGAALTDADIIHFFINVDHPENISEIKLMFDVGDASFTKDYYAKSIIASAAQGSVSGVTVADFATSGGVFDRAVGLVNTQFDAANQFASDASQNIRRFKKASSLLFDQDILPPTQVLQGLKPERLLPGAGRWSRFQIKIGSFLKVGLAGNPGNSWANVSSFRIQITTAVAGAAVVQLDDLYILGTSGLDVTGGIPYDWRVTYFNNNTGWESNPSPEWIPSLAISSVRQGVQVGWTASGDSQVTHVRIYRRGGSISSAWYMVAQIAIGTTVYTDTIPDALIVNDRQLELDNDPPVTSLLPVSVYIALGTAVTAGSTQSVHPASLSGFYVNQRVTVGQGTANEEDVIIQSINTGAGTFAAYFQYAHGTGDIVQADTQAGRGLNLSAVAFDQMWLAGDSNNPHYLYYSKRFRPESFPPQNYLEIGSPSDPIMAVLEYRSQLYVFTLTAVYNVVGASVAGTAIPFSVKTACRHGLFANFAWARTEAGILFLSGDGVYNFHGGPGEYVTERVEWLFTNQNLGPVVAMDPAQRSQTVMSTWNNEVYLSYIDTGGARRRLSYNLIYKRWRNDSLPATAMYFEEDTYSLVVALKSGTAGFTDGMIYQDRVNDYDSAGFTGGVETKNAISFVMWTPALDLGDPVHQKVFNEFTIDLDSSNQPVTVALVFDKGMASEQTLSLGTFTANGRTKVRKNIQTGNGFTAFNVSIKVTGAVTAVVTLYGINFRVVLEAELRKSFDTWWLRLNTDTYKLVKQGYFEYVASDAAGIIVNVYIEGQATAKYSFTLPQQTTRGARRVRFPAVKAKLWRLVATSSSDFMLYGETSLSVKPVGAEKGYAEVKLAA